MIATLYDKGLASIIGPTDITSDTLKLMLLGSGYTLDKHAHDFADDLTAEVTGTGYTAGGKALTGVTLTTTAANSWATTRANSTAYAVGTIVRPASGNGHLYRCIVAGTSGGSVPTWPTVSGQTVTDGGVTWAECGEFVTIFDADDVTWTSASLTGVVQGVVYKSTGTAGTSPLLIHLDWSDAPLGTGSSGSITITWNSQGIIAF